MTTFRKPRNHRTRRLLRVCHAAAGVRYGMRAKRSYYLYADEGLIAEASQDISLNADGSVTATSAGAGAGNTTPLSTPILTTQYGPRPNSEFTTGLLFIKTKNTNGQDTVAYYHHDHLDTPIQATDKAGNIVWAASYNAFGQASITTPQATADKPTITSHLRLPGQYEDLETGLHYNWHRYYDAQIGRYVTSDPIGIFGGINRYAYAEGDPLNKTDPKGLWVNIAGGAVIGGLGNLGYQLWNNGGNFKCVDLGDVGKWALIGGLTGALVPEGLIASGGMQTVTRWGPAGKWVMTGGGSWRNWLFAGGPELGYSMSTAVTREVSASSLAWPAGWEAMKGLIGQRVIVGTATIGGAGTASAATSSSSSCECKR